MGRGEGEALGRGGRAGGFASERAPYRRPPSRRGPVRLAPVSEMAEGRDRHVVVPARDRLRAGGERAGRWEGLRGGGARGIAHARVLQQLWIVRAPRGGS